MRQRVGAHRRPAHQHVERAPAADVRGDREHEGIAAAWKIVTHANAFVDSTKPFSLAKDPAQAARLDSVLYHLAEALTHVSVLLNPIMPTAMATARAQIGWALPDGFKISDLKWGLLSSGHQLGAPVPLFPRLEIAEEK